MPAKKKAAADMQARYKVLIAGISLPGKAPAYEGEIVTGSDVGDAERVAKLLELGRIERVDDEDEGDAA